MRKISLRLLVVIPVASICLLAVLHSNAISAPNDHKAAPIALPSLLSESTQNGIDIKSVDQFWAKWRLVTVRFRNDNQEQRFVYANPIAWEDLQKADGKFRNGAEFAKIAFATTLDHAFPNSVEPASFTRIQLMKKDMTRFSETDGWSYALVTPDPRGVELTEADRAKKYRDEAIACHACHQLVKDRDYVFSTSPFIKDADRENVTENKSFGENFDSVLISNADAFVKRTAGHLPAGIQRAKIREMKLFIGSVGESVLPIASAVLHDTEPYLLYDAQSQLFILGHKAENVTCKNAVRVYLTQRASLKDSPVELRMADVCGTEVKWLGIAEINGSHK